MKITHVTLMNSFCLPLLTFFLWMFAANQDAVPEPNASQQVLLHNVAGSFYLYNVDTLTVNEGASGIISGVTNNSSWVAQAFVDLNGDGDKDILMRHTNGSWFGYLIKDGVVLESGGITISANTIWQFKAAHDFNGDGTADVLLRNSSNGTWFVYLVDGLSVPASGAVNLAFNQDWKFQGVADFNGDGKGDVLLRHQVNKSWFLYALDGVGLDQSSTGLIRFALNPNWEFAAANDFTGDGKADIIMRRNDGPWWMYQADGTEVLLNENFGILALTANTAWEFQGAFDFNGDNRADVLLRNQNTGTWYIYALDGREKLTNDEGYVDLTTDTSWSLMVFGSLPNDLSNASLNNSYLFVGRGIELDGLTTESAIWTSNFTFDGSGGCSIEGTLSNVAIMNNSTGALELEIGTAEDDICIYNLSSMGTLTTESDVSETYVVSPDSNIIIGVTAWGDDSNDVGTDLRLMVKQSSSLSNASLNGMYLLVGRDTSLYSKIGSDSFMGTNNFSFDGSGGCSYVGTLEQGAILNETTGTPEIFVGTPDDGTCIYHLAANGLLTIDDKASYAVSPDTDTIIGVYAGDETGAVFTNIELMLKQSSGFSNASLNGKYINVSRSTEISASKIESFMTSGTMTFDGLGGCTYVGDLEQGAIINETTGDPELFIGTPDNETCTYSLSSNGVLTIDDQASYALSSDTNTIFGVVTGSDEEGAYTGIQAMVRASQ